MLRSSQVGGISQNEGLAAAQVVAYLQPVLVRGAAPAWGSALRFPGNPDVPVPLFLQPAEVPQDGRAPIWRGSCPPSFVLAVGLLSLCSIPSPASLTKVRSSIGPTLTAGSRWIIIIFFPIESGLNICCLSAAIGCLMSDQSLCFRIFYLMKHLEIQNDRQHGAVGSGDTIHIS